LRAHSECCAEMSDCLITSPGLASDQAQNSQGFSPIWIDLKNRAVQFLCLWPLALSIVLKGQTQLFRDGSHHGFLTPAPGIGIFWEFDSTKPEPPPPRLTSDK